jgi:hypothetical protein
MGILILLNHLRIPGHSLGQSRGVLRS